MDAPFVTPTEPSASDAIAALKDEFEFFDDWMDRYEQVIDWGRALPAFPDAWKEPSRKVEGCQSQVWIEPRLENGRLWLAGASDAAIVQGLVAMLLRVYSGRTPQEILATDPGFLTDLDLIGNLSTNRGNGIAALIRRIRAIATAAAAQAA
ncbi:SufE family protein [Elioraea tepidiphila]|jgi:cysteine desulfuration protein SufE|uniref:SufE family protein n=1 Tax=Elioraea tepidiphila TaxID=457934 RepID=UPI0003772392|nr:SufE family protein [Elioraea tepidiphila]